MDDLTDMSMDEIIDKMGWNTETVLVLLRQFLLNKNMEENAEEYLRYIAKAELEESADEQEG